MKEHNQIVVLVGICGTGKRAVGEKVAQKLGIPFFDVDQLAIAENLHYGTLPQDVDMKKWLTAVEELIRFQSAQKGCVISCSILKKEHRKTLTARIDHELDWVFMNDKYENVVERVVKTKNHNRPIAQLRSDFETLEVPKRALTIDMRYSEREIVDTILKYLARKYG